MSVRLASLAAVVVLAGVSQPGIVVAQAPPPLVPFRGLIDHASVNQWGGVPYNNTDLFGHAISGDGRYVVMSSTDGDLVPYDVNWVADVFLRDRMAGTTTRLSVSPEGGDANEMSYRPTISTDGHHVAFASGANNLVPGDTNGFWDVFVRDLDQQRTVRVSIASDGSEGNFGGDLPAISATGRYVAFVSSSTNLAPGVGPETPPQVYVHDRDADGNGVFDEPGGISTALVNVSVTGGTANQYIDNPRISADGRFVLFESQADNLSDVGNPNFDLHLYLNDRQTGLTTLIDRAVTGGPSAYGIDTRTSDMTDDGRFVTFSSYSHDIVFLDMNWMSQVFRYDASAGPIATTIVSVLPDGTLGDNMSYATSISADGRYVAFTTQSSNLAEPDDDLMKASVAVRDMVDGTFTRADLLGSGEPFDHDWAVAPSLSADGTTLAFASSAVNAVGGVYTGYAQHAFVVTALSAAPLSASYPMAGGTGSIDVNTSAVSGWTADSDVPWIVVFEGAGYGAGPRTIQYEVAPNDSGIVRNGHIRVGSTTVAIHQEGDGDTTPPVITPTVSGTLGPNGWYISDVSVEWSVSDPDSEIVNIWGCQPAAFTSDFLYAAPACEATSHGGTSTVTVPLRRDTTGPAISLPVPKPVLYPSGVFLTPSFWCDDGLSGVDACWSQGSLLLDTLTPGWHTVTINGRDLAGNISSRSVEYLIGTGTCVAPAMAPGNLKAWWPFNGNYKDRVSALDGVTQFGSDRFVTAVAGQGWDNYASQNFLWAWAGSQKLAGSGLTIAAWVNPRGQFGESGTIVDNPLQYRVARYPDGTLRWAFAQTTGFTWVNTGVQIPLSGWSHIAITYQDGVVKSYLSGRLVHTAQLTGTLTTNGPTNLNMTIGGRQGSSPASLNGIIDDVMIFDAALPAADIDGLALAGSGSVCAPFAATLALTVPATMTYGAQFVVSAVLTDAAGHPVPNRLLTITSAITPGYVWNTTTDSSGSVTVQFPVNSEMTVGSYPDAILASFAGDTLYAAAATLEDANLVGGNVPLTWPPPAPIVYGTALGASQLNATTNFIGTYAYAPPAGTVLDAGTQPLTTTFTPNDLSHWAPKTISTTIDVTRATPAIEISNASAFYTGQPRTATAVVRGIGGVELNPVTILYNGSSTPPVNAGTYELEVRFDGNTNYEPVTLTGSFVIAKATPIMSALPDVTSTYDGQPWSISVNVAGVNNDWLTPVITTYNGSTENPVNAGVYAVEVRYDGSANYSAVSRSFTLTILKAAPSLAWANPAAISYGVPLGAEQLNASSDVAGTFTYSPAAGAVLNAGTHTLNASFTPADTVNHSNGSIARTLEVSKASAPATWSQPAEIVYGTALGAAQLNATAPVPGTFTYAPPAGIVLGAGEHVLSVTFTPEDAANYNGSTASVPLTVAKAAPGLSWASPAGVVYGTALDAAQLNASANVPGTFSYAPAAGAVLAVGTHTLSVTFTPSDAANYTGAATTRALTVARAPLTVTAVNTAKPFGAPLPVFSVTAAGFVNGDSMASLSGALSFATSATAASPVGGYAVTPQGLSSPNYTIAFGSGTLTVVRASTATAVAAGPNPGGLNQPETLTATVSAIAPGAGLPTGIIQFFDGGILLGSAPLVNGAAAITTNGFTAGSHTISASHAGDGNFDASSGSGGLTVATAAASSTTVVTSSANQSTVGQNVTLTATITAPAGLSGSVAFYDGSVLMGTVAVSGTTAQLTTSALAIGGHAITAWYLGNAAIPPSVSPAFPQYVRPSGESTRTSTTALTASPSPATLGSSVTLTATVTGSQNRVPTGVVTFMANGVVIGQGTLSPTGSVTARATFGTSALPHGTHKVEAVYLGDSNYRASVKLITLIVN